MVSKLAGDWRGRSKQEETHKAEKERSQTQSYIHGASSPTNQLKTKASDSQDSELQKLGCTDRCVHSDVLEVVRGKGHWTRDGVGVCSDVLRYLSRSDCRGFSRTVTSLPLAWHLEVCTAR